MCMLIFLCALVVLEEARVVDSWDCTCEGSNWNPCFSRHLNELELDNVECSFSRLQRKANIREGEDRVV